MAQPLIIAHRTCPLDAAENSLEGMRVAAQKGADGVEIDLRMSLDQRPFLLHDWTLRRTASFPLPLELTPSPVVRGLHLINGETLPSLADALDTLDPELLLAVDVKTPWAVLPLLREIRRRRLQGRVLAWCTSALAVRFLTSRAPEVETAYLKDSSDRERNLRFIGKARHLGARAVSAHWDAIDAGFVAAAHGLGLRVYSWDGGRPLTPEKLTAGLDGLITDRIELAREALAAL
jgi:glycerophosphoryl diester phosphodiesterase